MSTPSPDIAWDRAFEALSPLAQPTAKALTRVQAAVDEDRRRTDPLRAALNPSARAAVLGVLRFGLTTAYLTEEFENAAGVWKISGPQQEAQHLYFWQCGQEYVLRVKHEPQVTDHPGTRRLWDLDDDEGMSEVFLCWDSALDYRISNPRFATLEEPRWTVPLTSLLAQSAPTAPAVRTLRPGVKVRSNRDQERHERDHG